MIPFLSDKLSNINKLYPNGRITIKPFGYNVSQACKTMGYSRDSFYRFKKLYENGGEEALREIIRKKPIMRNRVPEHVERAVIELAIENPALGQLRVSQELFQRGIVVSAGGVRSIWLRKISKPWRSA